MASVLDTFVIQLGLDSSGLSHGALVAQRSMRGMNDDVDKTGSKLEQAGEKGSKAFKAFRTEAMAAFALFTGGRSLEGFIKDTTDANTALGNLSRQLDIAPQKLNQLRYALQGAGANPAAAEAMFQALQAKSTDPREQARVRNVALTQAGIEVYDRNNHVRSDLVEQLHASKRFNGLSRAIQDYVLSELGGQGIAPLLRSPQYNRLMAGTAGGGPSKSDIEAAEKLKADFAIFSKKTNDIQQMIYGDIAPAIDWFVEKLSSIEKANPREIADGLEAVGGALFLLSGALTGLGILKAIKGVKDLSKVLDILKKGASAGEAIAGEAAGGAATAGRTGGRLLGTLGLGIAGRAIPWISALWPSSTAANDTTDQSRTGSLQTLIGAIGMQESHGNPNARSKAGAEGLLQFMPRTAAGLHINPYDPVQAWHGAEEMVTRLLKKYRGDQDKALAAYNWGEGNLDDDIRKRGSGWRSLLPVETANYIATVNDNMRRGNILHLSDYDHRPTSSVTVGDVHVYTNGRNGREIGRDVQAEIAKINRRGV